MGKLQLLAILIFGVCIACFAQQAGKLPAGVKRLDDGNSSVAESVFSLLRKG